MDPHHPRRYLYVPRNFVWMCHCVFVLSIPKEHGHRPTCPPTASFALRAANFAALSRGRAAKQGASTLKRSKEQHTPFPALRSHEPRIGARQLPSHNSNTYLDESVEGMLLCVPQVFPQHDVRHLSSRYIPCTTDIHHSRIGPPPCVRQRETNGEAHQRQPRAPFPSRTIQTERAIRRVSETFIQATMMVSTLRVTLRYSTRNPDPPNFSSGLIHEAITQSFIN